MRLALERDERLTARIPDLRREHIRKLGRKHIDQRQTFLCRLLTISYERRRPHQIHPDADSFSQDFLRRGLRVSRRRDAIRPFLDPFYEFEYGNRGYDWKKGITKAYRLRDGIREALDEIYTSDDPLPVESEDTHLPRSANGVPPSVGRTGIRVPPVLPLGLQDIDRAIERVEDWMGPGYHWFPLDDEDEQGPTLGRALRLLHVCRKWTVSHGGIPNIYSPQSNGRLGPGQATMHVITLPNTVRRLLLNQTALVDYDISSCHWSILQALARHAGVATPKIDMYVANKADWHSRWGAITGHSQRSSFKAIAASWLTGAVLSASPETSGGKLLGYEPMSRLVDDSMARDLYTETRRVMKEVVKVVLCSDADPGVVNAVGRRLEASRARSKGAVYSHVLTGFEQFAMRVLCRRVQGLQAIIYDGFIAPPQDVWTLESSLLEASERDLGIPLDLRLKADPFSRPIADRGYDPERDWG